MKEITPGLYPDVSSSEYHQGPGVSKSGLTLLLQSPQHYFNRYLAGAPQPAPTPAMIMGTALHTKVLEPKLFNYIATPDINRRTAAGKLEYEAVTKGKIVLKQPDMAKVTGMSNAIANHPTASALLAPGEGVAENSAYWTDQDTKVLCKCRPDFLRGDGIVIDVKTAKDASALAFGKAAANYGYYLQAAFYLKGISIATETDYDTFIFIVVESAAPYPIAIYALSEQDDYSHPSALDLGRAEMAVALSRYKQCAENNHWHGYSDTIQPLILPRWAFTRNEYPVRDIA